MTIIQFFLLAFAVNTFSCGTAPVLLVSAGSNEEASKVWLEENGKNDDVVVLPSGLQYKILKSGNDHNGDEEEDAYHPNLNSRCECHYEGRLLDGTVFDSSYKRGEPAIFAPNEVIPGWTEAMQLMVEGDKWELYVPPELAYGDSGRPPNIQGGDALIFVMELVSIVIDKDECDLLTLQGCSKKDLIFIYNSKQQFGNDPDYIAEGWKEIEEKMKHMTPGDHSSKALERQMDILMKLFLMEGGQYDEL